MASQSNSHIMSLLINDWLCYTEKKKEKEADERPFSLCPSKWTSEPTHWPEVSHPDIYNDLTESFCH